jgi:hypothetical protein
MAIYAAQVSGSVVAIFNALDADDAAEYVRTHPFQSNLADVERGGLPAWDGADPIAVREAKPDERHIWQRAWADAERSEGVDEDAVVCVFLHEGPEQAHRLLH